MKKRVLIALFIALFAVCTAAGAACFGSTDYLAAPQNVRIENEYLKWDEVSGADFYMVEINGVEYSTEETVFDIFDLTNDVATYEIYVSAYRNSLEKSSEYTYFEYKVSLFEYGEYSLILDDTAYALCMVYPFDAVGKVVIPETIDGLPVRQIASGAFYCCDNMTSVVIPDSVQLINSNAFSNCTSLSRVKCGSSVTSIGDNAFEGCSALMEFSIPNSVSELGEYVFENCTSLSSVTFSKNLTDVDLSCFYGASSYESLNLPEGIERLSLAKATSDSDKKLYIKEVYLPSTFSKLYASYFSFPELEIITIADSNKKYKSDGNCVIELTSDTVLLGAKGATIPDYAVAIGNYAFEGRNITEIYVPDGVTEIGQRAFYGCEQLVSVTGCAAVETISENAFYGCSKLTDIEFHDGLKSIGNYAFFGCSSLESVTIPESVTLISFAFRECAALKSAQFENTVGWIYNSTLYEVSGSISSAVLSDPQKAAYCLRATYCYYTWRRSNN